MNTFKGIEKMNIFKERENRMTQKHNEKYDALIEKMGGLDRLIRFMPVSKEEIKKALDEGDEHLNSISLYKWDKAAGRFSASPQADEKGDYCMSFTYEHEIWPIELSLAERVCILKRAAKRWANE